MLSRRFSLVAYVATLLFASNSQNAAAQFYGNNGCSSCGTAAAMPMQLASAPVSYDACASSCTPIQPVMSTCYQTVPVTTYTQEKQTVERPYYQTSYEEREVTVMRPVTRQREVEVPTVSYQNVTEYRTVNRDMGRWVTQYQPVSRCSPCEVDPRPGVIGWLNRTGYSMRTAFMPSYTTSRQYVPNMMACSVPVTRQVAVQGTRRVTVAETQMVAEKKIERVPVQKLAYRKEEVTVMRPQTAYRTVPIGTSVAYAPGYGGMTAYSPYYGGSAMAYGLPIIEDANSSRTALGPKPDPIGGGSSRSADNTTPFREDDPRSSSNTFKRSESPIGGASLQTFPNDNSGAGNDSVEPFFPNQTRTDGRSLLIPARLERQQAVTVRKNVTESGWKRTTRSLSESRLSGTSPARSSLSDSRLSGTRVSLADNSADN